MARTKNTPRTYKQLEQLKIRGPYGERAVFAEPSQSTVAADEEPTQDRRAEVAELRRRGKPLQDRRSAPHLSLPLSSAAQQQLWSDIQGDVPQVGLVEDLVQEACDLTPTLGDGQISPEIGAMLLQMDGGGGHPQFSFNCGLGNCPQPGFYLRRDNPGAATSSKCGACQACGAPTDT